MFCRNISLIKFFLDNNFLVYCSINFNQFFATFIIVIITTTSRYNRKPAIANLENDVAVYEELLQCKCLYFFSICLHSWR